MLTLNNKFFARIIYGFAIVITIFGFLLITLGSVGIGISCAAKPTYNYTTPILLIVVGISFLVISVLGLWGIVRHSYVILFVFAGSLAALSIILVVSSIVSFVRGDTSRNDLKIEMETMMDRYNTNEKDKQCWDTLQQRNKCCGVHGYEDWLMDGFSLPSSCCHDTPVSYVDIEQEACNPSDEMDLKFLHPEGCYKIFEGPIKRNALLILFGQLFSSILNTIGLAAGFWLAVRLKRGLK